MWVRSIPKTMTENSRQPDPAEALRRTLSEHANQIHFHDSSLHSLSGQQHQTNQQLEQITTMLQQTLNSQSTVQVDGTVAPPVSQQLPHCRDITSPNSEKFSGEVGNCKGFLLQCNLVFNCSPRSSPHDDVKISYIFFIVRQGFTVG
ncbi:hypothetical protein AMECASPLE_037747 [Ameca splendens]|uniref:Uncharacterized protein n=1 Tax=Ameca splendens TaxID=208324 RepID=A0ABV0YJ91_9TELE